MDSSSGSDAHYDEESVGSSETPTATHNDSFEEGEESVNLIRTQSASSTTTHSFDGRKEKVDSSSSTPKRRTSSQNSPSNQRHESVINRNNNNDDVESLMNTTHAPRTPPRWFCGFFSMLIEFFISLCR